MNSRRNRDFGSVLLGSAAESAVRQRVRIQTLLTAALIVANLFGVAVALALVTVGIPEPQVFVAELWWANFIVAPIYIVCAFAVGILACTMVSLKRLRWSIRGETPTAREAARTQRLPRVLTAIQAVLWLVGAALLTTMYGIISPITIPKVLLVTTMSGAVVISTASLLVEFALRPVSAELITAGYGRRKRSGLRARSMLSWVTGSAIPIVGIICLVLFGVFRAETSKMELFVGVTVLAVIALVTGFLLTFISSLSVTGPIRGLRSAMRRVQNGNIDDAEVVVYDGTELGDLQAGFNSMTAGLAERERMRDLFGRHVGHDVAEAALNRDPELGGIEREAAALFVDVIGSTTLAQTHRATEVVALLNDFFAVIVRAVEEHDGLVNKFEGDAVLAVFGAPLELDDPAGAALAAARKIAVRLPAAVPEVTAGIGVSFGTVVAGNVGAIERFEYTIIGDPVNESARLSELAKRDPCRPLASGRAVDAASSAGADTEVERWERQETTTLRGRSEPTVVYCARV